MGIVQIFGYAMAAAVILTGAAMFIMGAKWQKIEATAYAGERRPWWFYAVSAILIPAYLFVLYSFLTVPEKTIAGWILVVLIPVVWGLKSVLLIFNKRGRQKISSISGDGAWKKIAAARMIMAIVLIALAFFA